MEKSLFEKIACGDVPAYVVWQDESYMAFLTPFPNTEGFTVVIPKVNHGDYVFSLNDEVYIGLLQAVKKVAKLLEKAFNTPRIAMVFEGTGIAHVHAKLIPLHGPLAAETNVWSKHQEYYENYVGYLTTVEGPKQSAEVLEATLQKIRSAA